jgi:hypothetical protein
VPFGAWAKAIRSASLLVIFASDSNASFFSEAHPTIKLTINPANKEVIGFIYFRG